MYLNDVTSLSKDLLLYINIKIRTLISMSRGRTCNHMLTKFLHVWVR